MASCEAQPAERTTFRGLLGKAGGAAPRLVSRRRGLGDQWRVRVCGELMAVRWICSPRRRVGAV